MADRYIVATDTDFRPGRTVYDVVDMKKNKYMTCSFNIDNAHDYAREFNSKTRRRKDYDWEDIPNG